VDKSSCC